MDYKEIIRLAETQMETQIENGIMSAVKKIGIDVDKERLMKALMFDREQYSIGYRDGYLAHENTIVKCRDCVKYKTSECIGHLSGDPYLDWDPEPIWFCGDGVKRKFEEEDEE